MHSSKKASNIVADRAAAAAAWQTRLGVSPQATQASKQYDEWEASLVKEAQAAAAKEEGTGTDSPPPPAAEEDEPEARNSGVGGVHIAMIYPATLGSSDFDYHVGDKIATPSELHATQFSEAAMLLPFSAYPTDYRFAHPHPLRRDKGVGAPPTTPWLVDGEALVADSVLPATSFRFANFNQLFKVEPRTAASWGNVLRRTPGARLWQLDANVGAEKLTMEFGALGLGKERLWWSERKPLGEHLARINSMAARWSAFERSVCLLVGSDLVLGLTGVGVSAGRRVRRGWAWIRGSTTAGPPAPICSGEACRM